MSGFLAKPRTIMVTGGAGLLGSHLCNARTRASHDVLHLENIFTGSKSDKFSMVQLATMVLNLTGHHCRLEFTPLAQDDPRQRQPDISPIRRELAQAPTIRLEEGLANTLDYFQRLLALS